MKKFLVYLLTIIAVASMGFAIFYLVRDNEKMSISRTSLFKDVGDTFELSVEVQHAKSYTTVDLQVSDTAKVKVTSSVLKVKSNTVKANFKAEQGGVVRINFQTSNANFRNLYCDVLIGDGTQENPFYISTAAQLARIGTEGDAYTSSSYYELVDNIDLTDLESGIWTPLNSFSGTLIGNGYTINNLNLDGTNYTRTNLGLFESIEPEGTISNVKFNHVDLIVGKSSTTANTYAGTVCGTNKGTIERVQIANLNISNISTDTSKTYIGGVCGYNISSQIGGIRKIARIDRVSVVSNMSNVAIVDGEATDPTAILGNVGGITGYNHAGIVIYSYARGTAIIDDTTTLFGGIVAKNEFGTFAITDSYSEAYIGANVKDCYVAITTTVAGIPTSGAGAIIGSNTDRSYTSAYIDGETLYTNKIMGNYYDSTLTALTGCSTKDDAECVFTGLSTANMKLATNYLSHKEYEFVMVEGVLKQQVTDTIGWNFDVLWSINTETNDGYPALNYDSIVISDDISINTGASIVTSSNINTIFTKMDGVYVIASDITLSGEWNPIGTETKPFVGQLSVLKNASESNRYYRVSKLKISGANPNQITSTYAGFFGVVGGGAKIDGLTLLDVEISGAYHDTAAQYVGAVVAQNGVDSVGGKITNCTLVSGTVSGYACVGGICGVNYGTVTSSKVTATSNTTISNNTLSSYGAVVSVGGLVGLNFNAVQGSVQGKVLVTCQENNNLKYIGGAVGYNFGTVSSCSIMSTHESAYGITTANNQKAHIGGIVGHSTGVITGCAMDISVIGSSSNSETYAGGIVGYLFPKAVKTSNIYLSGTQFSITKCVVNDSVEGNTVGGIAGYVKYNGDVDISSIITDDGNYWTQLGERWKIDTSKSFNTAVAIVNCEVLADTTLSGSYTGGLVGDLVNGFVVDSYSLATLSGANNAGFAYMIGYNSQNGVVGAGVIYRCYAKLNFTTGTNYEISQSEVRLSPTSGKFAGFFTESVYCYSSNSKSANAPKLSNDNWEWLGANQNKPIRSADEMTKLSTWTNLGWNKANMIQQSFWTSKTSWNISDGYYPTLK